MRLPQRATEKEILNWYQARSHSPLWARHRWTPSNSQVCWLFSAYLFPNQKALPWHRSFRNARHTTLEPGHWSIDHTTDKDRSWEGICCPILISAVHDPRGRMTRMQWKGGELFLTITGKGHAHSVTSLLCFKERHAHTSLIPPKRDPCPPWSYESCLIPLSVSVEMSCFQHIRVGLFGLYLGPALEKLLIELGCSTHSIRKCVVRAHRQVNYDSAASNLITKRSTQAGFSSSQFFTYRSPRAATLTHIQVFIRLNRCQRCAWGSERAYLWADFSYSFLTPSVPERHNYQEYRDSNEIDV